MARKIKQVGSCWGLFHPITYRSYFTPFITGDGAYLAKALEFLVEAGGVHGVLGKFHRDLTPAGWEFPLKMVVLW